MKTLADDECKEDIVRRLRTLRLESGRRWGRMSAHQMVCHLGDACRMATGAKPVRRAAGRVLPALLKWIALYAPLQWRPGIPTTPEIDQDCDGTKPADFAADVAAVEQLLDAMTTREQGVEWPGHPVFGRMSHGDWLRWGYLHTDHHLRQFGA
jgi:hypothetical protein